VAANAKEPHGKGIRCMAYVSTGYETNPDAPIALKDKNDEWIHPKWVSVPDPSPGESSEYGQCVSYVRFVTKDLPKAKYWKQGKPVKGNKEIGKGTVIATFNKEKHYHGHAAIYESQSEKVGIAVVDQWITPPAKPISRRVLRWGALGNSNNGDHFYVVD
jgi:hypothetical protein